MTGTPADSAFYRERIAPHLPPVVLDFHAHVWRKADWYAVPWKVGAPGAGYMVADEDYPVERLLEDARMVFEGIDSSRVLYATDFPVAAMAGRRVRIMDHWVDVVTGEVPASAYRVRAEGIPAAPMAQEIAFAVVTAGRAAGLPEERLRHVFFENGMRLLRSVQNGTAVDRVEAGWQA